MDYFDYNARDGEQDHVHVEIPYEHKDGEYGHMTRIAEHGVDKVLRDGGWHMRGGYGKYTFQTTARFIYNWGSGPVVEMVDGTVVKDER